MRLDARNGDGIGWLVWHVERCEILRRVVWVDDETMAYFQLRFPLQLVSGELAGDVHRARLIVIYPAAKLVMINPIDLTEFDVEKAMQEVAGATDGAH